MRFARLHLRAYGRFGGETLAFARAGGSDLHLVYGPNEAGKSTTLNAVTDLLFGFEHRVAYDFRHAASDLRIGASLDLPSGPLHVVRRRGRTRTLFAFDPATLEEQTRQPLPEETLGTLLGGLDRTTYRMLFGLDLDGLEAGGQALLAGAGEVGQSLFQAAAGLSTLKQVGDALDSAAGAVYKTRGRELPLNRALAEHAELVRAVRDHAIRPSQWEEAERRCATARQSLDRLRAQRREAREASARLERIRKNLPYLARREALVARLAGLADVPRLPADAAARRMAAEEALRGAERALGDSAEELELRRRERAAIRFDPAVPAAGDGIEGLFRGADAYVEAREDAARQAALLEAATMRVRSLLAEIAPGVDPTAAAALLPSPTQIARVRRLVRERGEIDVARDAAVARLDEGRRALASAQALLGRQPPPAQTDVLELALERLDDCAQVEQAAGKMRAALDTDRESARRRAAELGAEGVEALAAMRVPTRAELNDFRAAAETIERRLEELQRRSEAQAALLEQGRAELRQLEATGDVVTRAQIERAREQRDRLWRVVRRLFVEGDASARAAAHAHGTAQALPDAFEQAASGADALADRWHADTARATRFEALAAQIEQRLRDSDDLRAATAALEAERAGLRERWRAACQAIGLGDVSVAAVHEWLDRRDAAVQLGERIAQQAAELRALDERRTLHDRELDRALADCRLPARNPGEPAAAAMQRLRAQHGALLRAHAEREASVARVRERSEEIEALEQAIAKLDVSLAQWSAQWRDTAAALQLPPDTGRDEAEVRLGQFERLARGIDEMHAARAARDERAEAMARFERRVAELAQALGRAVGEEPAERWVRRLHEELASARADDARAREIDAAAGRAELRRRQAVQDARAASDTLAALARDAGCAPDALAAAHARSAERSAVEAQLEETDRALIDANGRPVADVAAEAAACDVDGIARALDEAEERMARLDDGLEAAQREEAEAARAFQAIETQVAAVERRQEQAVVAARVAALARQWSRARIAAAVLQSVVQQYRDRHQGPLLARAGALFAAITCDGFSGLTVDYDDGRQVLLGVRADRSRVEVSCMSKGTRDQLFLALRLATIEAHVAGRGPLPVIVDDLLVQFDDARAAATLRQLRTLAERTQVLFFTHHEHLVDIALEAGIVAPGQIHRLTPTPSA